MFEQVDPEDGMAIKVQYKGQYVDMGARRFSSRLRPSVVKLAVVIILLVAATAAWSQTQFPYTVLYKFPLATNPGQIQQYAPVGYEAVWTDDSAEFCFRVTGCPEGT